MRNTIYLQYIPKTGLGFIVAKNDQSALFEKEIPIATGTPPFFSPVILLLFTGAMFLSLLAAL